MLISYEPLWKIMEKKHVTTYTLQVKGGISSSSIRRLKAGDSVSTNTLDSLCKILGCTLNDIVEYKPDDSLKTDDDTIKPILNHNFT